MDAGYFRGTNADQDGRFSDKEKKLLKQMKFEPQLESKVEMDRVNLDVIKPWISDKINQLMGIEDDVLIEFIISQLEDPNLNPKKMQINITGFLNARRAREFMGDLWALLIEANESSDGIPQTLVDKKMQSMKLEKKEDVKPAIASVAESDWTNRYQTLSGGRYSGPVTDKDGDDKIAGSPRRRRRSPSPSDRRRRDEPRGDRRRRDSPPVPRRDDAESKKREEERLKRREEEKERDRKREEDRVKNREARREIEKERESKRRERKRRSVSRSPKRRRFSESSSSKKRRDPSASSDDEPREKKRRRRDRSASDDDDMIFKKKKEKKEKKSKKSKKHKKDHKKRDRKKSTPPPSSDDDKSTESDASKHSDD